MNQEVIKSKLNDTLLFLSADIKVEAVEITTFPELTDRHIWVFTQFALFFIVYANNIAVGLANSTKSDADKSQWLFNFRVRKGVYNAVIEVGIPDDLFGAIAGKGYKNITILEKVMQPTLWQVGEKNQFRLRYLNTITYKQQT